MKKIRNIILAVCAVLSFSVSAEKKKVSDFVSVSDKVMSPISVQLWSVREFLNADFEGTLRKIAVMGFDGVEFAGDYGSYKNDPEGLKGFLDSIGLRVSGAHVGLNKLKGEEAQKTIQFLKAIGVKLIIIPADSRAWDPKGIHSLVKDLTQLNEVLGSQGLTLGYHNHDKEFGAFKEETFWDFIAKNTPKSMCLQMDVAWVNIAGKDPLTYVKRYPGRTLTTHIKIRTKDNNGVNTIIGQDDFDWAALAKIQLAYGGVQWFVIEQEEHPEGYTFLSAVEASKKGFELFLK